MKRALVFVILLAAAFPAGASALTMDEAVALALENSHLIKQYGYLHEEALEGVGSARSGFWPTLGTGYEFYRTDREVLFQGNSTSALQVEAAYNLFKGFSDISALREARSRAEAQGYRRDSVTADVVLNTRLAYVGVLRARRAVETAREGVELLERQLRDNRLFYREGLIPKNELLKVEVELASARQDLIQAEGDYQVARRRLERVMGVPVAAEEAVEDFEGLPDIADYSFDSLRQMMLERRSELAYLRSLNAADAHRIGSIKGGYYPSVDLSVSYTSYGQEWVPDGDKPLFGDEVRGTVSMSWSLFDGFRKRHEVGAAKAAIRAREQELADAEEELTLQLRQALEDYRAAAARLEASRAAVGQAEENYRVTRNRFEQTVATTTDLLDARVFLTRARTQFNGAVYDVHAASARIARVIEEPSAPPGEPPAQSP
ncbi:MAG: TolC family protein [Thermodesulfovibrionales bacterium]